MRIIWPDSNAEPEGGFDLAEVTRGGRHVEIHSDKWHRCINHVKAANAKRGTDYNPYAVCTSSIGYSGSYLKGFRQGARTPAGRRRKMRGQS